MDLKLTQKELQSMMLTLKKAERIAGAVEYHGFVSEDKANFAKLKNILANIERLSNIRIYDIENIPDSIKQEIVDKYTYQNIYEDAIAYCNDQGLDYSENELSYVAMQYTNGHHDSNASHWDNIASFIREWEDLQKDDATMDME